MMFARIAIVCCLLSLSVGCAKKTAKFTGKTGDSADATPLPVATTGKPGDKGEKSRKDDKPNWLGDPRGKKDTDQLPVDGGADGLPGKPGWGAKAPEGGWTPPNAPIPKPKGELQPQPVAPPAVTTPPKSGGKPVTEADMKEVWIFMENASGGGGKLPPPEVVYAALVKTEAKAAELVKDNSILLTGATMRESIWAFEAKALTQGGWAASQNGVENLSAAELRRRLGR